MTLLSDGKNAFFAERGKTFAQNLIIHLPEGSVLFFNDICYFPQNGAVYLPAHAIRVGKNSLALRTENRILLTEDLMFDGEVFIPAGISAETLLLRQNERIAALEEKLSYFIHRLERVEHSNTIRMLFS